MKKEYRQSIIDGSTLFGVFLTLIGLSFGLPQLQPLQKVVLTVCSFYFLIFSVFEFLQIGYEKNEGEVVKKGR